MWIVKLGGSLAKAGDLLPWLRMLAAFGGGRVAVVPGGSVFADTVRQAQQTWNFNDLAAHNMAVLAMGQMALMMHALEPRLALVTQESQIMPALRAGRVALWMPLPMMRDAPDMLTSWEVSADSLSLWLARTLHAERLVVVKSCPIDRQQSFEELTAAGVLDARFAQWAHDAPFPIELVERQQVSELRDALVLGNPPGAYQ
jgi:5-(aminomethyl)-3-furanmethanol phosphate kinase